MVTNAYAVPACNSMFVNKAICRVVHRVKPSSHAEIRRLYAFYSVSYLIWYYYGLLTRLRKSAQIWADFSPQTDGTIIK